MTFSGDWEAGWSRGFQTGSWIGSVWIERSRDWEGVVLKLGVPGLVERKPANREGVWSSFADIIVGSNLETLKDRKWMSTIRNGVIGSDARLNEGSDSRGGCVQERGSLRELQIAGRLAKK